MADQFMWYKYICKNVAKRHGKTVTFMPKPIFEDNGSGMHTHTSLWKGKTPLFAGDGYAGLSEMGLHAAGGLLKACAGDSRLRRADDELVPQAGAGVRSTGQPGALGQKPLRLHRIPMYSKSPKSKRLEFRCPDPSCNGYLAWSAMLMAMMDGIQNRSIQVSRSIATSTR
jgi:glutamine synthetase